LTYPARFREVLDAARRDGRTVELTTSDAGTWKPGRVVHVGDDYLVLERRTGRDRRGRRHIAIADEVAAVTFDAVEGP
jgi:hypothetical protein